MLLLICQVGVERYALDGDWILEVVPRVKLKEISQSPKYIVGLMNLGGEPVPVIDFCQLIQGRPCDLSLHSRIILLQNPTSDKFPFGLLAEKVTETIDREKKDFLDTGIQIENLAFLGGILQEGEQTTQWVFLEELSHYLKEVEDAQEFREQTPRASSGSSLHRGVDEAFKPGEKRGRTS